MKMARVRGIRVTKIIAALAIPALCVAQLIGVAQEPPAYPEALSSPSEAALPQAAALEGDDVMTASLVSSLDYFRQRLSAYGRWAERPGYGMVWVPKVAVGWLPYTTGHWTYTDQGLAWVADEPWGWAPFHYGRWYYDLEIASWGWVPGNVWAPAWVAWRRGAGYLGWAPLSPTIGFTSGVGLDFGAGVEISPAFYTFITERKILALHLAGQIVASSGNIKILPKTTNITNYTVIDNLILDSSVSSVGMERVTGRVVPRLQVAALAAENTGGKPGAFFQPAVVTRAAAASHAEFGKALATQVALQQRRHYYNQEPATVTALAIQLTTLSETSTVQRSRSDLAQRESVYVGMKLAEGDLVESSSEKILLEITCRRGSLARFSGRFRVAILPSADKCAFDLRRGNVDILAVEPTEINFAGAVAGSRSTLYSVRREGDEEVSSSRVLVYEGELATRAGKQERIVKTGSEVLYRKGAFSRAQRISDRDFQASADVYALLATSKVKANSLEYSSLQAQSSLPYQSLDPDREAGAAADEAMAQIDKVLPATDPDVAGIDDFHAQQSAFGQWMEGSHYEPLWAPKENADEPPPYPANGAAPGDAQQSNDQARLAADGAAPADPVAAGIDYFHGQLSPYGQWVARDGYGMVWVPNVAPGWRPYTVGHWAYTDQGWAWVGDEPWGWAAYHYGRWYYDGGASSWAWVPGYTWAPAWVDWRHGGGYLGWAPLPPSVGFAIGDGLVFGGVVISPGFYTFVGERDILAPRIGGFILPSGRNAVFVAGAGRITNYTFVNNHIVNVGVSSERIALITGHPVNRVTIASMSGGGPGGGHGAFYQPTVIAHAARAMPAEFGSHLSRQIAVQQKSQSYASVAHNSVGAGHASTIHGTGGTGATNGSHSFNKSTGPSSSSGNTKTGSTSGTFKPPGSSSGSTYKAPGSSTSSKPPGSSGSQAKSAPRPASSMAAPESESREEVYARLRDLQLEVLRNPSNTKARGDLAREETGLGLAQEAKYYGQGHGQTPPR
jgi:hypothetical protein